MRPSLEHLEGNHRNDSSAALSVKLCGQPANRPLVRGADSSRTGKTQKQYLVTKRDAVKQ